MKRLQILFDYMFYRIAGVWYKYRFERDMPEINAFVIVSLMQTFNIVFLIACTGLVKTGNKYEFAHIAAPLYLSLITINCIFILNKKKLDICKLRWQDEKKKTKRIRGFLIIGYILASFGLFAIGVKIMAPNGWAE